MEGALLAGESLADDLAVLVDQNAHDVSSVTAGRDDFLGGVGQIVRRDDVETAVGQQLPGPSRRWCLRAARPPAPDTPTSLTAVITPSAIRSQRTMPPKILTRMALHPFVGQDQS